MEVIMIESEAFYALIDEVVKHIQPHEKERWISEEEALDILNIRKTRLWELRKNGDIRYSQPSRKIILYDRESLMEYIEKHAKNTF